LDLSETEDLLASIQALESGHPLRCPAYG
jgi:hypothetical protein